MSTKSNSFRIVKDIPILDIVAVIISLISLLVTIFIATGILHIHKHIKRGIQEKNDNDDDD